MIEKTFWKDVAGEWARRTMTVVPEIDVSAFAPPDDADYEDIDFDDLDDFFQDILDD